MLPKCSKCDADLCKDSDINVWYCTECNKVPGANGPDPDFAALVKRVEELEKRCDALAARPIGGSGSPC